MKTNGQRPIIGITSAADDKNIFLKKGYFNAVFYAGGFPMAIACLAGANKQYIDAVLEMTDGIIFTGGGDIHAKFYNEPVHEKSDLICVERDEFELALMKRTLELDKPMFAICRGSQVLNVAMGGSLTQHIDNHAIIDRSEETVHDVSVCKDTLLHKILNKDVTDVNSLHHQCVGRVGDGLIVAAKSPEGIIEAIELPQKAFVLGVQWHPERIFDKYTDHAELFKHFINTCAAKKG